MIEWKGQRVLIVGAARQGMALARFFANRGAQVVLNDRRSAKELSEAQAALVDVPLKWVLGGHPLGILDQVDWVCPSGGVPLELPLIVEALARRIPLANDSQVFLEHAPCKVIGITGSAGKTTTTTLVGRMADAACELQPATFNRAWIGGNIGNPLIADVDNMNANDIAVMELSSFQLDVMTRSPQVAAVLNITPNHLDRHGNMRAYTAAKARILKYQTPEDVAVLGRDDPGAWGLADSLRGDCISFGRARPPEGLAGVFLHGAWIRFWDGEFAHDLLPRELIHLRGEHNLENVLAACAIAAAAGIPPAAMRAAVDGFAGVSHRLEFVRTWRGADWYNDSIATAPERALAALNAFDEPLVLLAGGRDKNLPWDVFAEIVRQRVDHLVLFGEAAALIRQAVEAAGPAERPFSLHECNGLQAALEVAAEVAAPGDVVLLSPGGTSFDEFKDFSERGVCFRAWLNQQV